MLGNVNSSSEFHGNITLFGGSAVNSSRLYGDVLIQMKNHFNSSLNIKLYIIRKWQVIINEANRYL